MTAPSDLLIRDAHPLDLIESTDPAGDGPFNADGTVNVALIRPCDGRGPGARIYTRDVLEATAPMYSGWASYMNHEDPRVRRAAAKMRRGPNELAGELRETTWDPTYTTPDDAKYGYEAGAVVGKFMPASTQVEEMVRRIPRQLKLSIKAQATGLRPQKRKDGTPGMLVEGIEDDPENSSFDLVTAAGAGGHVLSLVESIYDQGSATDGLTIPDTIADADLLEWLQEHRPNVLGGADDMNLQEALQSDEVTTFIGRQINSGIAAALPDALTAREMELRESIRAELGHEHLLRSLASAARDHIDGLKLNTAAKAHLHATYSLVEQADGTLAGPGLALIEAAADADDDEDGYCVGCKKKMPMKAGKCETCGTKMSAKAALKESIDADAAGLRAMLAEAAPSVPWSSGPGADAQTTSTAHQFGGEGSGWAAKVKSKGLNPALFGAHTPAKTD
jgi:hypothetical protein